VTARLVLRSGPAAARIRTAAFAAAAAAVVVAGLALARDEPAFSPAGPSPVAQAASLAAGALLIVAALLARGPVRSGTGLLVAAGAAWLLAPWAVPNAGSAPVFSAALLATGLALPLAVAGAARALAPPRAAAALAGAVLVAAAVAGPLASVFEQPHDAGCAECPRNLLALASSPDTAEALARAGAWAMIAAAGALAVALAAQLIAATGPARRRAAPMIGAVLVALAAAAAAAVQQVTRGDALSDPTAHALWLAQAGGLAAIAAALGWSELARRRRRDALAVVTARVASSEAPGGLRAALARALGDPTLELGYPLDGTGTLVGTDGAPVAPTSAAGREHTRLVAEGRTLAVAGHRAGLLDDPALAHTLAQAAGLALEHEALTAELAARLRQLRASRALVVAAGDAERRRLEQDLHDGAQQRLASLALNLQLVEAHDDDAAQRLHESQQHLRAALEHLRALAHGIFPRALAGEGLAAALEDIADDARRIVRVNGLAPSAPETVEATAYLVVATLASTPGGPVGVVTSGDERRLVVTIDGDTGPLPPALRDRVDALGGTLAQQPGRLRLELPCGS
jgi:signal transduction histidine kinase